MEEDFPESPQYGELQTDLQVLQDQQSQDQEQQSLQSSLDQVQVQDKDIQGEAEHPLDPPQDQLEVHGVDQGPADNDPDRTPGEGSDHSQVDHRRSIRAGDQDPLGPKQSRDPGQGVDLDTDQVWPQDQGRHQRHAGPNQDQDQDQDLTTATAYQEAGGESGGSVPALVITQAEESRGPVSAALVGSAVTAVEPAEPQTPQRPADLVIPAIPTDPSLSSGSDGGDMTCSDLLSLRSDSLSLASEPTISRTSEEDDSRSVAASSVMSLFHRVQLDPLEKDWLRSSAVGNMAAQRRLLLQESSLVFKKTALHWAAKQGRQEAVDLMLRSGADVNVRSGYTALHLASIHGHQHVIHALINCYNAKINIRDYHGKTALHYWSGCSDVFVKDSQSGGRFDQGRRTQRHVLPSLLLSRSRSQGQLNLDLGMLPQSASHDVLDLQL